ncbi:MAG: GNAT family N-acetyltransferase [Phycisphaerae bacterium]
MSDRLEIIAPDPQEHREGIFDLTAKTFAHHGRVYWGWIDHCTDGYIDHSRYDWSASSVGLLDGRLVTHWGVWDYRMRVGSSTLRVAGIGAVATHGRYRRRGLMDRTARASLGRIAEIGYDMSLLFGRADYYERFGYVRAWSERTYVVDVADLPTQAPAVRSRKFALRHRDDLAKLYNRQYAGLTGTAVRPTYIHCRHSDHWDGYLWNEGERPAGYVVFAEFRGRLEVLECVGDGEQALRVIARQAKRRGYSQVHFSTLHHDHPLSRRLRWGTCRIETHHRRSGGPMVRTINPQSTLGKIAAELSRRLSRSPLADWNGTLRLADAREKVDLKIDGGKVQVAAPQGRAKHAVRGGEEIAQLLIGTAEPLEIAEVAPLRLSGDAKTLLPVLFPAQHPQLSSWDRF